MTEPPVSCQKTLPSGSQPPGEPAQIAAAVPLPPVPETPTQDGDEPTPVRSQFDAGQRIYAIDHPVHWAQRDYPDGLCPNTEIVTVRADRERQRERARGGRPPVVDEQMKYNMLELLSVGLSLRMTAAHVGVSHQTVANLLAGDARFAEEVRQTRERAKVYPLNCVLRECGRSWRAAAWLMEFMQRQALLERSATEKHLERVGEQALKLIEKDLADKVRKQAAEQGHPWYPKPQGPAAENPLELLSRPAAEAKEP
ncbi:MAG TPA: hypothetical protein VMP01_21190 [Pirellulaceae bacterium]|nr:hypothetical protein [Pirellulaceae bacterium]